MSGGYDLSVATISPDGRVFQVEYAQKSVEIGSTSIAFVCKDGIIFASEKYVANSRVVRGTNSKIYQVSQNSAMCLAGNLPDGRKLVDRARDEVSNYKKVLAEDITGYVLAERVGLFIHQYTLVWNVRPFGSSVLLGTQNSKTKQPELYSIDPSGACYRYFGMAYGKGRQIAKVEMEKLDLSNLTVADALKEAAKVIVMSHEESKDKSMELELSFLQNNSDGGDLKFTRVSVEECIRLEDEVKDELAKEALESSEE